MSKGTLYKVHIMEETPKVVDKVAPPVKIETKEYIVTAETGIFKQGKAYKKGDTVVLVKAAGEHLIKVGEVKEKK